MNFADFYSEIKEIVALRTEVDYIRDSWDDYGAKPGCDCGCGGDTFPWDAQADAFEEADLLEKEADERYDRLKDKWEVWTNRK